MLFMATRTAYLRRKLLRRSCLRTNEPSEPSTQYQQRTLTTGLCLRACRAESSLIMYCLLVHRPLIRPLSHSYLQSLSMPCLPFPRERVCRRP